MLATHLSPHLDDSATTVEDRIPVRSPHAGTITLATWEWPAGAGVARLLGQGWDRPHNRTCFRVGTRLPRPVVACLA